MILAFPRQSLLRERAWVLLYAPITCLGSSVHLLLLVLYLALGLLIYRVYNTEQKYVAVSFGDVAGPSVQFFVLV
jgi:hypothetical protein